MNLLVAIDSFKGSASSKQLNEALLEAIDNPKIREKKSVPIADGGEGTLQALYEAIGGEEITEFVPDLMGRSIEIRYLITSINEKKVAIIESAAIIGIEKITPNEQTIKTASTFGLGKLLLSIIDRGIEVIYLTLGGSGTSDGGLGLLAGLGATGIGGEDENPLYTFDQIELKEVKAKFKTVELIALADVTNPYVGENGFSNVFGLQKGGTISLLAEQEILAKQAAVQLSTQSGIDIANAVGAGAAGGLGGAILALGGTIAPGFTTISELIGLEEKIKNADLVITGEGRIDVQTEHGKVPFGVAKLAQKYHKPVFALCGTRSYDIGVMQELLIGAFSIHLGPIDMLEAMDQEVTLRNVKMTGAQLVNLFLKGREEHD